MDHVTVRVNEGLLRGQKKLDIYEKEFLSFEGIPYGKPPVGELRFKSPLPVEPWQGIRDALNQDQGSFCKQEAIKNTPDGIVQEWKLEGSEDCLNLNVYTKKLPDSSKSSPRPVMVYIHGGAFVSGTTRHYGPQALITQDVVLVSIHYRLGPFGFLVFEDPSLGATGNAGLKDQVLALKWIQRNIAFFNGNPDNVTIFGQSAGGVSVHALVLSPSAKGLFHKAVIQSGTALNIWSRGHRENAKRLARILGCDATDEKDIFSFLQKLPAEKIVEGHSKLGDECPDTSARYFGLVVEPTTSQDPLITEEPFDLMKSGKYNHVPIMIGFTDMEILLFYIYNVRVFLNPDNFKDENLPPPWLKLEKNGTVHRKIAKKLKDHYFGNEKPEVMSISAVEFASDNFVTVASIKTGELFTKSLKQPLYFYEIRTPHDHGTKFTSKNITGVPHAAELLDLFEITVTKKYLNGNQETIRKRFLELWANFATFGKPTEKKTAAVTIDWEPTDGVPLKYLDIGDELTMKIGPEKKRMEIWEEILKEYPNLKLF